jgi:hypothetical protein
MASESSVPENVWAVFETAISEAEAGLTSWLRLVPTSRILWLLTLPAAIPLHIAGRIVNRQVLKGLCVEKIRPMASYPYLAYLSISPAG